MSKKGLPIHYYNQQLNDYSSILRKTVEITRSYTEIYEEAVADDLYHRLHDIGQELKNTPLDEVSADQIEKLKNKYELSNMAIFTKENKDIFIYSSTTPEEIGRTTKDWGYWNDAFENLFAGEIPIDEEGYYYDKYWIGPRSKSHYDSGYYRYAYYYNTKQDYLINGIIEDDNRYEDNIINMLDDFFDHLDKEVSYIDAIALLDIKAWEKAYHNNYKSLEAPAVLYGRIDKDILVKSKVSPEDLYAIEYNESLTFQYEGDDKTLFMISASDKDDPYCIVILLDDQQAEAFIRHTLSGYIALLIFTLAILVIGIYYIVIRYKSLLTFQEERNKEVERFTKDIAMLPEISYKCRIQEGELMLTYNYGRSMHEEHKVSLASIYRPMREIYPSQYVEDFKALVNPVFKGEAKRFEINYENELYEHFTSPIFEKDGSVKEIIGLANNITDRKLQENEAKYYATHDHLTDLTNRRTFEDTVQKQINHDSNNLYAMLLIDLDNFKSVNDTYGHLAGDAVLKEAAKRIKDVICTRSTRSIVARMGGDEFSAYIPYEEKDEILDVSKDIISEISKPYLLSSGTVELSASIGISLLPLDASTYNQLLHYADIAMYKAKMVEGDHYKFFSKSMSTRNMQE